MPEFVLLTTVVFITLVMSVILGAVAYLILLERKISAWMQDRLGPNRIGLPLVPFSQSLGLGHAIVDGIKMLLKEDIIPKHVDKLFFIIAPSVSAATALLAFAVVPFGPSVAPPQPVPIWVSPNIEGKEALIDNAVATFQSQQSDYRSKTNFIIAPGLDIGFLFTFAITSLAAYGIVLGGWSSDNKYSLLGALRSSAQLISYEIPLGTAILAVVICVGSLNLERIVDYQVNHGWLVSVLPLGFILFLTSVFAECNRLPFDLPDAEQELVGGYHTEYSSLKFGLFFLGEYIHMITTSFMLAILFFGGWYFPGIQQLNGLPYFVAGFAVLFFKVFCFILLYMLVRWTLPRFRFDQLMGLAWQVLIPLGAINIIGVMIVQEFFSGNQLILLALSLLLILTTTGLVSVNHTLQSKTTISRKLYLSRLRDLR